MQCQRVVLALLLMLPVSPLMAADGAPGRGLKEIPDPELNLMRGRYTVGGNNVAWFGVTMISQWQGPNGAVVQGALTLGMDFRNGGTPKLSFQPSVHVTAADAPLPATLRVACLRVAPQAEMLPLVAPSHSYLALLEARAQGGVAVMTPAATTLHN